jgi:choline transport protein
LLSHQVSPKYHVPFRSIILVTIVIILLSLVNIGSTIALNAILSLSTIALYDSYISYLIPIALLVAKRVRKESIQYGPFQLGNAGLWIDISALTFDVFIVVFLPFPAATPVTAMSMNYAGPVSLGLVSLSLID